MISLSKNKICLIIPSLRHGGAERVMSILANEWAKNSSLSVNIILLTRQEKFYKLDKRVNLIEPKKQYNSNFFSKLLYKLWCIFYIRNKVSKINPDSVLSFCHIYNNLVLLALFGTKNKVFVSDRNNPANNIGLIHEKLRKVLYNKAAGIIAQTSTAKEVLFYKTRNKNIEEIPNPLRDIKKYNLKKENIIINVGRLETQKNQLELVEIFSQIENKEDWKLQIIGNGNLNDKILSLIKEKKLEERVEILDFKEDIDQYMQKAKIFAFTSIFEGFPNALAEAMANELAVISYDCPTGPSELIQNNENGFLIELGNQQEFVKNLQILIDDNNLRSLFESNAVKVKQNLSLQSISDRYLKFILK